MKGNWNRIVGVDLGSGKTHDLSLPEAVWRDFVGGSGVGAWMFLQHTPPTVDPLSAENPLMILAGPIVGTTLAGSSRFGVCARSPLTGIWGEGTCGGNFGPMLKSCGIDGLYITGRAASPVYLFVEDGNVSIRDAADLWGKDTYETGSILEKRHDEKRARVICIGPAGENLVKYANINNDRGDVVGRTGMGAVMGSKKVKAVVVLGAQKVQVADQAAYDSIRKEILEKIKNSVPAESLHSMGTDASMDLGMMTGDIPIRNWSVGEDFELSAALGGPTMTEKFLVKPSACLYCTIACKRVMKVAEGPYAMEEGPGPEYETCCSLGTGLHNKNAEWVLKANELANKLGMDTITLGSTLAFAMDCFEKGILSEKDTGGTRLSFGSTEGLFEMMEAIARRQGFGDVLAEGSRAAAAKIGKGAADLAVHVKGLELPYHDPHGWHGMGLAYMMSTRGACHLQHLVHPIEQGMVFWEGVGLKENYEGQKSDGKGAMVKIAEDLGVPCNAMVLCNFVAWTLLPPNYPAILKAVTGFDYDLQAYLRCGARIWLLKRGLSNLMGVSSRDDVLPPKILVPYKEGAAAGSAPDQDLLRKEYYAARGIGPDGRPAKATLEAAGALEELTKRLYK
jgi:aldehyde:ferredoxin oxidoreductase